MENKKASEIWDKPSEAWGDAIKDENNLKLTVMNTECTLSNEELILKCNDWVSRLAKSGGKDWRLNVPVSFNTDPDMLFCELANRFKTLLESTPVEPTEALKLLNFFKWVRDNGGNYIGVSMEKLIDIYQTNTKIKT